MRQVKRGFIVIFALIMVSLVMLLTEQLVRGVFVSSAYAKAMFAREQAKLGVYSGMEIARAQLTKLYLLLEKKKSGDKASEKNEEPAKGPENEEDDNKPPQTGQQKFIAQLLPMLNRWQTVTLDEATDGVAMEIKLCLVCEQGKINLNQVFDFKKQEFQKLFGDLFKTLEVRGKIAAGEFEKALHEFLTKRRRKLEDITQLSQIPALQSLNIFYQPPAKPANEKEKPEPNVDLALGDIFTVWTDNAQLDPLVLSDALCAIFTFRRPLATDAEDMKERYEKFAESYKPTMAGDLEKNWELFQLIYDQKPPFLKEMQGIFSKEFGPSVYSVLCYATVQGVTQRALGIVKKVKKEKRKKAQQTAQEQASNTEKSSAPEWSFELVRLYWL